MISTFVDAEKCFDKLWLKDCLISLWEKGMKATDIRMIYMMNKKAKVKVNTQSGMTSEFAVEEIVKQGTVLGPKLCCSQTDDINRYGKMITTMGKINIDCRIFVDDMATIGRKKISEEMINSGCQYFEKYKKFSFSVDKSKIICMNKRSKKKHQQELKVRKGEIKFTKQYRYLGDIIQENGSRDLTVTDKINKARIYVKKIINWTSFNEVGNLAISIRLLLYKSMIIPMVTSNMETWGAINGKLTKELEKMQHQTLVKLLEQKVTTSYWGILIETGLWPLEQKIDMKKMLFWHDLLASSKERQAAVVLRECLADESIHPWRNHVKSIEKKYDINIIGCESLTKDKWKSLIKVKVLNYIMKRATELAKTQTKLRFCKLDKFWKEGKYLTNLKHTDAIKMMEVKLNMNNIKSNFKNQQRNELNCPLCEGEEDTNEHLVVCEYTRRLRNKK